MIKVGITPHVKSFLQPLIFSFWLFSPRLVGRPPSGNRYRVGITVYSAEAVKWNFSNIFIKIFLRSNSGDGGVRAGYALVIMENWGFGTASGTIQTEIMLLFCYGFGFTRRFNLTDGYWLKISKYYRPDVKKS